MNRLRGFLESLPPKKCLENAASRLPDRRDEKIGEQRGKAREGRKGTERKLCENKCKAMEGSAIRERSENPTGVRTNKKDELSTGGCSS